MHCRPTTQGLLSRFAIAGLLLAVLSSVCGPCIAAVADQLPSPAQESSGDCHPGEPEKQSTTCECDCPVLVAAGQSGLDAAAPSTPGDYAAPLHDTFPSTQRIRLAGDIRPGGLPDVPRLSPVRSFCTRLE
jgi:hypothetical protein